MKALKLLGILIVFLFASCKTGVDVKGEKITAQDALRIIETEVLDEYQLDSSENHADSIYTMISLSPMSFNNSFKALIRRKTSFYVFQDGGLIYKNGKNKFYKGRSIKKDRYLFFSDSKKQLHNFALKSDSPLNILIKHHKKRSLEDLLSLDDYSEKKIKGLKEANIPLIQINTYGSDLNDEKYTSTKIEYSNGNEVKHQKVKMKIRGSSSKSFPKKQFSIKSKKPSLFKGVDMKKAVLYAPYSDRSLLRNKLSYDLHAQMSGTTYFSTYCNVIMNDVYEGVYLLLEHPKQQFARQNAEGDDSSFLVQINRCPCDVVHETAKEGFTKPMYVFEYPSKPNEVKRKQIDSVLYAFEQAMYQKDLSKVAINDFIDLIIINELSKNIDAYRLSTYLDFDGNEMGVGPIWDYNIAWGMAKHANGTDPEGFVIKGEVINAAPYWWQSLWEHEEFQRQLKTRYQKHRKTILSKKEIYAHIDLLVADLGENTTTNFEKWPLFGRKVWPSNQTPESHKEEIIQLKKWIELRLQWLDIQWE